MAPKGAINELVSDAAFSQEERLLRDLKALNDEFGVSIRNAKIFSDTLAGAKSLKDININSAKAAQELEKLNKLMAQTAKATDQAATAALRREQAEARAAVSSEKAAEKAARLKSEYEQLSAEHVKLRANAQNLGVVFGTNSKQFIEAAKNANVLDDKLKDIDKQLGKSNRFVGEYERGNRGLSNSINQLTRELPAFTFSAQTGFLALSNNIPIFFDQIKQTREEITRLREAGEKAPSLFKQLATSFFSFGTALSIGVTLLTVYGKEIGNFISALFKGKEAMDVFAERQKAINDVYKNSNKDIGTQITSLKYLYQSATDVNNAMDERLQSAKKLQETYPKTFGLQSKENIINGEASGIYKQLSADIIANARAKAAAARISDEVGKQLDAEIQKQKIQAANENENAKTRKQLEDRIRGALEFEFKRRGKNVTAAQLEASVQYKLQSIYKTSNDRAKESIAIQDQIIKRAQINIDAVEKLVGGATAIGNGINDDPTKKDKNTPIKKDNTYAQYLQQQREVLDGVLQYEKSSYEDRLTAIDAFEGASKLLIDKGVKAKEFSQIEANTKILDVTNDAAKERNKVNEDAEKAQLENEKIAFDLRKQQLENYIEEEKRLREENIASLTDASADELLAIQDRANQSLIINEEAYSRGEIGKAEYEKNKLDIEHEAAVASINEQIRLAKVLLDIQDKAGIDTKAQRKALSDFERKLAKEDADYEIAQIKTVGEARKRTNDEIKNLQQELFKLGSTIVNASFEEEKNQIQERKDALTEETQREIDAVNRSIGTQQEKADKIAIIQAKAKSQQDVLDLRKREVAQRQAKFDKAIALSSVVQNTYAGAARALKDYPYPFSAIIAGLVIATGLASAANIIATPIPKYAKGTDYHKGGPMIVGDAGTELVIEPNGRQYITPDTDTLTTAPTGTKVIPHHELIKMIASPEKVQYVGGQSVDIQQLVAAQKQTTKAIQSQKMMGTLVTKKGWARQQGRVSSWNNHKRNYLN